MAAFRSLTWWVGIGLLVAVAYAMVVAAPWGLGGRLFPWVIGGGMILSIGIHSILGITRGVKAETEDEAVDGQPIPLSWRLQVLGWIVGCLVLVPLLGHQVALPVFIIAFMLVNGEKLWIAVLLAAIVWAFIYFVLEDVIHVALPPGLVFQWLGF